MVSALFRCFYSFVSQVCHCWCRPFSVGHVAFLFVCLPGLSLPVSALFRWPCSISIHDATFLFICFPGLSLLVSALFCWACSISIHLFPGSVTGAAALFRWPCSISIHLFPMWFLFFLSFRFGACTAVFCPVRWNRFACERFLLLCKGCVAVSGIAILPHCVTLSALFVRHQKSISCRILRSSCFCFLSSRGQLPAD